MGRTVPTFRRELVREIETWKIMARALKSKEDVEAFNQIVAKAMELSDSAGLLCKPRPAEAALIAICVALQREINAIQREIKGG